MVRVWDIATGQAVQVLQGGSHSVKGVDFGPDGDLLATIEPDQTIALWEPSAGRIVRRIGSPGLQACGLEVSPDGALLASGHVDALVRLWDVESGDLVRTLSGMEGLTCPVAFSPDGALVASGGGNTDSRVLIWDAASGQLRHTLAGHAPNVYRVVFSPDGTLLASASGDRTAKIWDVASGRLLHSLDADQYKLMYVAFSPDGRLLASGGDDGQVRLWDVGSGELVHTLRGHSGEIYTVAFAPVDRLLASAGEGGDVLLWQISSTAASSPATSSNGSLIAFVSTRDGNGEIYVMDVADALQGSEGSSVRRLTNWHLWDGYPSWSPDGRQIAYYGYLSDKDWVIKVMDVADALQSTDGGNPRQLTDNGICDGAPHWSPDGTRIAYNSDADCTATQREVYVMQSDGSGQTNLTQHAADDMGGSWSPDSQQIVFSSNRDGDYEIYIMTAAGDMVRQLTQDDAQDMMAAWSPDGNQIAFVSDRDGNDEIYVMDLYGDNVQRLTHNAAADWFPFWSPDGQQIVFSSRRDGNVEVYVMDVADALQSRDGSGVRRLTHSRGDDFNAVWQPVSPAAKQPSTWIMSYGGDSTSAAFDAAPAGDGGYLLVGATNHSHRDAANEDIHVMKVDAAGQMLWERTYGGDRFDRGKAILPATGAGFAILAETESFGAGGRDIYLLRIDGEGSELGSHTFGGPGKERANAIRQTAGGGYILAGQTDSLGTGGGDLYLVRTDEQGREIWSHAYGDQHDEEGYDLQQTPDGGFLVLGQVVQGEAVYVDQKPDILLLRTDGLGEELWSRVWTTDQADGGHALLPTSDGGYLIAGITAPAGDQAAIDVLLVKVDADGNQLWNRTLGDPQAVDYGSDAIELPGGGFVLTGLYNRSGRGAILLAQVGRDGEVVWTRTLVEGRGNKVGMRLLPAPDGGYLIVGTTDEFGRGLETVLVKTDGEGNVNE